MSDLNGAAREWRAERDAAERLRHTQPELSSLATLAGTLAAETFEELFALAEPFANVSLQGAEWFIGGSTITAVTADAITLRTIGGATQRIYRRIRT